MLEIIEWLHDRLTRQSYQQSTTIAIIKTTATILTRGTLISIVIYFYALLRYCLMHIWMTLLVFFLQMVCQQLNFPINSLTECVNIIPFSLLNSDSLHSLHPLNATMYLLFCGIYFFLHFRVLSSLDDVNTLKTTQLIVWFKYSHCLSVSHHTTNAPQILI